MTTFQLPFDDPAPGTPAEPGSLAPEAAGAPAAPRSPEPPARAAPSRRVVYTVAELTARIRDLLEGTFVEVWVEGELSNCRLWNTGHLYFTLKDGGAQLKGVMFRSDVRALRFKPEDGLHVVARGRLSVYDPKGEYQIVCGHLEPHGLGALQLAFDQLKKRLRDEGLFDAARKRPLPILPRRIGIATALDGAAIRDIIKILRRRHPTCRLVVRPTRVQGEGAAAEIVRAIDALGRVPEVDVVIVGRGGGSIEDLWAFNEEPVARAIARCPVPVISAVGHETDVTIADFVADVRAPTPSAAAELVVARRDDFRASIDRLHERLRGAIATRVARLQTRVHTLMRRPAVSGWPARLALHGRRLGDLAHDLHRAGQGAVLRRARAYQAIRLRLEARDLRRELDAIRHRLSQVGARHHAAMTRRYHRAQARLQEDAARLHTLSPLGVLARGYSLAWTGGAPGEDGGVRRLLREARTVARGDSVRITLHRGELDCEVTDVREE